MRLVKLALTAVLVTAPVWAAAPAAAQPPNVAGYTQIPADPYLDAATGDAYFQTPSGLLCAIRPTVGRAGCDGALPGAPAGANEIALSADQAGRGLRATSNKQFVKSTGAAAPVLPAGRKIVVGDMECAAADAATTLCTKGTPAAAWFVVKPGAVEIGPRTAGLPPGYPDPNDFVVGDESYTVGDGAKNVFPAFTVANGLSCRMVLFSGGEIGCNGTLPGVKQGYDEVYVQLPGTAGVRLAGNPPISTPTYSGTVKQLPAGRRIDAYGATCMALTDGGVACFGATGGPPQGFWVSAQKTTTFVGP